VTWPSAQDPDDRRRSFPPRPLAGRGDRRELPRASSAVVAGSSGSTGKSERHSFEAVEELLPNLYPAGTDPARIWLPPVPQLHSAADDEAHHWRYWQVHVWKCLLRYRRAYAHPACTDRLRTGYPGVDEVAARLAQRVASGFPLTPIDSVRCHAALRVLEAGATTLESTVAALATGPEPVHPEPTTVPLMVPVVESAAPGRSVPIAVPDEATSRDLFVTAPATPGHQGDLGRHGAGRRRHRHARAVRLPPGESPCTR